MLVDLGEILRVARENGFAVPAFNVSSSMMVKGIMATCIARKTPVILALHPNELAFVGERFVPYLLAEAHAARVPVCIHLDHGATYAQAVRSIRAGFTSVMLDASLLSFAENIALTKRVVEVAHAAGVTVEGELGTIGASAAHGEACTDGILYTNPDDAQRYVEETGIDALAVAVGTAHGLYPKGKKPQLRLDLVKEIRERVRIPLVLHGGSDNPDEEIREAIHTGISKINISSDTKSAFYRKCREVLKDEYLREPLDIYPACIQAMNDVVSHKIDLFGSGDSARYYP